MSVLLADTCGALRNLRTIRYKRSFYKTQHPLVQELRTRKATDPKDMYYGVAGILNEESPPTTKESLCDHYRALCTYLVQKTKSLDTLLIANSHSEESFPSWVINWNSATPQTWDKVLFYFSSSEPRLHVPSYRSSMLHISKSLTYLYDVWFKDQLPGKSHPRQGFINGQVEFGFLQTYQGVAPDPRPSWEFRNDGQDLCVRGLLLTHISSHNASPYTEIGANGLRSAARALAFARNQDNNIFSESGRRRVLTSDHPIRITGSQAANRILDEIHMITAFVRSTFSGMTESERVVIDKGFATLWDMVLREMEFESRRGKWWHKLRLGMSYIKRVREMWRLSAADNLLRDNKAAVVDFLRSECLIVVQCEATASYGGGLGFAGAAAREGDVVALVSGVSLPLVLRSCHRAFKLIGPLFLPGVMDGELKDLLNPETLDDITLV